MATLRLLERLARLQNGETLPIRAEDVMNSIRRHLKLLLNTMQGSCLIDPALGLADLHGLSWHFSESAQHAMADQITRIIQQYEPRLERVRIQVLPPSRRYQPLQLQIDGEVNGDQGSTRVVLNTDIEPDGNIVVY